MVAVTRQNVGSVIGFGFDFASGEDGGVNGPPDCRSARVITVSGNLRIERAWHRFAGEVKPYTGETRNMTAARATK